MSPLKINYPNGQQFNKSSIRRNHAINYANRGMSLEEDLNITNQQYLASNVAVIHKKPTPIQVVQVDYPRREAAKITEAYYRRSSTTDYNGVYQGYYLDFEAKETKNKTSFSLDNFHEHQIKHMKQCEEHGGICFTILRFTSINKTFLLSMPYLLKWWDQQFLDSGRKSIPLMDIQENCEEIPQAYNPRIPYLKVVNNLINRYND